MTPEGESEVGPGLFDQDFHDESGYMRDANVRLPRFGTGSRRRLPKNSAPLGAARSGAQARHPSTRPNSEGRPLYTASPTLARRRRNRQIFGVIVPLVILAISVAGLAYVGYDRYFADTDAEVGVEAAGTLVDTTGSSTTALLIQTDGAGDSVGFTIVALHYATADAEAGSDADGQSEDGPAPAFVIFVPATTMVEVPGIGLDTLASAGRIGGTDLASLALENLLTIEFDHVVDLSPAGLTELTRTFDPLLVDNPRRLDQATARDRVEVLYPAGAMLLPSDETAEFLARRGLEETDLDRLVRHQEFWVSLLAARSEVVVEDREPVADIDQFLDELAFRSEAVDYRILDVDLIGGEDELYGVDRTSIDDLVVRIDPGRAGDGAVRTRVQLLNGVGTPGLAAPIARLVNPVHASIELVDNAARFDHDITQVVYYRDDQLDAAAAIREALGVGDVVKQIDPIDVVDITIVVGADLASRIDAGTSAGTVVTDAVVTRGPTDAEQPASTTAGS